jgi:hypothetical protein
MSGFLQTIESPAGQTIGILRENGQVEDCAVIDPSSVLLTPGDRNHAPLAWDAGLSQWLELPVNSPLSANGMVSPSATTMVIGSDAGDVQIIGAVGKTGLVAFDVGSLQGLSGQIPLAWGVSGADPKIGFLGSVPIVKPDVTTGNLASLQTALSNLGLINLV